tara:strand:- start:481 stop:1092 length:612 start_codon:yes stop_codon:yes gene_type:complete
MIIVSVLALLSSAALASVEKANLFIEQISVQALEVIESDLNDEGKIDKLNTLFSASVDTPWMAQYVLGDHWSELSPNSRTSYLQLYDEFLMYTYVPKFRSYNNQIVTIINTLHNETAPNEFVVQTQISDTDGKVFDIDYHLRQQANGDFRIFDINARGVSLITTQRSDFSSLVDRKGLDFFLKKLKKRVEKIKQEGKLKSSSS